MKKRLLRTLTLFALGAALVFALWPASLDRDWVAVHAVTPQVTFNGDSVTVDGVRNFRFSPDAPPTGVFETRTYDLRRLETLWYGLSVFHPDGWRPARKYFGPSA